MLLKKILTILLIIMGLTSCFFSRKAAKPDYSTSIYTNAQPADSSKSKLQITAGKKPGIEDSLLKARYATYLKLPADSIKNLRLYRFIDQWLYTPYLWGGTTKRGIDCSAFMQRLLADVYQLHIPRTSIQQFYTDNVEPFNGQQYLSEGDLVFFKTIPGNPITHVGMYLGNNIFINASSSKGVSFGSLRDYYWATKYVAAGRLIVRKSRHLTNGVTKN